MRAKSIEEIREHLARGGRVNAVFRAPEDVPVQRTFEQLAQVNEAMLSFDNSMISHWELLPIEEETPEERQAKRAYDEMLKANAKLIAASPLMLEALEKFVVFHNADHDHIPAWELQSMYDVAINAAKDVIRKATGDE